MRGESYIRRFHEERRRRSSCLKKDEKRFLGATGDVAEERKRTRLSRNPPYSNLEVSYELS